jgi:hypothetical protein
LINNTENITMQSLTFDQLYNLPSVVDLITAAHALGIGRTKAYRLAHNNQFPCRIIRVGISYHIPTADLLKVLGVTRVPLPRTSPENSDPEQEG